MLYKKRCCRPYNRHLFFEGKAAVRTWLVGILKHKIADHWRRSARESAVRWFNRKLEKRHA